MLHSLAGLANQTIMTTVLLQCLRIPKHLPACISLDIFFICNLVINKLLTLVATFMTGQGVEGWGGTDPDRAGGGGGGGDRS